MEEFSQDRQVFNGSFRRPEVPLEVSIERELEEMDLALRSTLGAGGSTTPSVKALRATHHRLAQALATGHSETEASLITGYSPSRISILKQDPAFKDLLAHYMTVRDIAFVDVQQRMAGFATDALEELQERLETKPSSFSVKDLNELIKTTADRGGHSPVQKKETRNINISTADLENIKKEVESRQNGQVRKINQAEEARAVKALFRQEPPEDPGTIDGSNDNRPSSGVQQETEASGDKGQGDNL